MGYEIKISEIKSEILGQIANAVDTEHTKDGNLKGKEIFDFQQAVKAQNLVSEAENESDVIKNILGYTPSSQVEEDENQNVLAVKNKADNEQNAADDETPLQDVFLENEVADAVNEAATAAASNDSNADKAKTAETAAVKAETVTTETVVLPKSSKFEQLKAEYLELRHDGNRPKEAYKAVKAAHKNDKSKENKKAISQLKDYAKNVDAQLAARDAIRESDSESAKQVKKDAKKYLREQNGGKIDDWDKRAINGNKRNVINWISGKDSAIKEVRKAQAYGNKAKRIKAEGVTMETIEKKLGKKSPYFKNFQAFIDNGYVTKKPDGTYDISKLSDLVQEQGTGDDHTLSRQQNKPAYELTNLVSELGMRIPEFKGVKVKDKYVKRLVKLTGRHVEQKDVVSNAYKNTVGGALAGGLGAAASLFMPRRIVDASVDVVQNSITELNLTLNSSTSSFADLLSDSEIQELIEKGLEITQTSANTIHIKTTDTQKVLRPFIHKCSEHALLDILKGAGIGAAIGLLTSALSYGDSEQEIIPDKTECFKTYMDFENYIDTAVANGKVDPLYAEAAKKLALSYSDENLNLDCDAFKECLGYAAGDGSRLNRAELLAALEKRRTELEQKPPKTVVVQDECENCDIEKEDGVTININTVKFRAWDDIANGYDCFEKYTNVKFKSGATLANRMSKVIQAIDVDKVTEENVKTIFNVDNIAKFTEEAANNGIDSAIAKFPNMPVNKAKYKEVLSARGGVNGTVIVPTLYDSEGNTCEWSAKKPVAIKKGGRGTTSGTSGRNIKGNDKYTQVCKDENGKVISRQPSNKEAYDKKHPQK